MKIILLILLVTSPLYGKTLNCQLLYVTEDPLGNRINRQLPEAKWTAFFDDHESAMILERTKEKIDISAWVGAKKVTAAIAYQDSQSSFSGSLGEDGKFSLHLYFRGRPPIINKEKAFALSLYCRTLLPAFSAPGPVTKD
jgi:hypothetical protein